MLINEKNKNYQDILFESYHKTHTKFLDKSDQAKLEWFDIHFERVYKSFFQKVSQNTKILELGCNKGYLLHALNKRNYNNLYGVDLSPEDLEIAKKIVPSANLCYEDAFTYLKNNKNSFDIIILKALIEHISKEKILLFLELINNALTKDGMVLIDVYNADWLFASHERYLDFTHEIGFTKESLRQVMLLYFDNVKVTPTQSTFGKMGIKFKVVHYLAGKILFTLLKWADPECPSVKERLLIATGTKRK